MTNIMQVPQVQNLNEEERKLFLSLLSSTRTSSGELNLKPLEDLWLVDYEEVPVSIDVFLEDDRYLGQVFNNGKGIYPFWRKTLHDFFHNNENSAFELMLTGCLSGDTKIPLLNGTNPTIRELYLSGEKKFEVYSYDLEENQYTVGNTTDVMFTGIKPVYKITLDNGESVKVTSDHRFLTRNKHWKSIDTGLTVGDSLMPFNRTHDEKGYEQVHHPQKDGTSYSEPTHRMVMRYKIGSFKGVVHHKNFKKYDNSSKNLLKTDWYTHRRYHARLGGMHLANWNQRAAIEGTPENLERKRRLATCMDIRWSDPSQREKAREKMIRLNHDAEFQKKANAGKSAEVRERLRASLIEYNKNHPNIQNLLNKVSKEELIETLETLYNYAHLKEIYQISEAGMYSLFQRYDIDPYNYVKKSPIKFPNKYWGSRFRIYNEIYTEYGRIDDELVRNRAKATSLPSNVIRDYFNGDAGAFYEMVRNYNHKIVSIEYIGEEDVYDLTVDNYHNFATDSGVVVHNCIGSGKSTISAIALTYLLYRTLCLKNPQKFYGLTANSPIVFCVMNLTLDLAYSGLYSLIVEAIKMSPWFCERVDIRGKYNFSIEFPKNIALIAGSNTQHTIGKNVLGAVLDEVNFSNAPKGSKNSVMDMYRNIRRRMESRFLKAGRIPGLLMMVSSKNSELDFLEQYINSVKHLKTTWVVDKAIYDIKPPETYLGPRFKVAVGDKTKTSYIVRDEQDLIRAKEREYDIIEVPVEYQVAFEQDINEALKEIAGISAVSTNKLIPYAGKIELCIDKRPSPFFVEEISLGLDSIEDIKDFLDDLSILKKDQHIPRFGHVDIGLRGDCLGLGIAHASKQTVVEKYTPTGAIEKIIENIYDVDLMIRIRALPGSEIPLFKVREFLLWLNSAVFKLRKVTYDGFQSADSIQLLNTAGIDAGLQSLDRTDEPYLNLRSCILEHRLNIYNNEILKRELYDLEYDRKNRKVDHPMLTYDGAPGSKDLADGVCGAIFAAQKYYANKKSTNAMQHGNVNRSISLIERLNNLRKKEEENEYGWI